MIWSVIKDIRLFNSETTWISDCAPTVLVIETIILDWRIEVAHSIVRHIQIRESLLVNIIILLFTSALSIWTPINPVSISTTVTAKQLDLLVTHEPKYQ